MPQVKFYRWDKVCTLANLHKNVWTKNPIFSWKTISIIANIIGAGSRGAGGQLSSLEIFWPSLGDFCPPWVLYPGPFLEQKNASNPAKTLFILFFFIENAWFWVKKTLQIRRRVKKTLQFRVPDFSALGLAPPCPKIVPAPLIAKILIASRAIFS